GHQCISYSGQCLISSLIGKRSGNRGVCASSCRKRYNGSYLISPKDLMLAEKIDELRKIGIDSVKIEGRMKSPEYVAITTKTYRKQIDSADKMQRLSERQLSLLKMGFNRDFTPGFFSGEKSIVGKDMPMNRGILLGTVYDKVLRLQSDLKIGDGIGFFNPRQSKKLQGFVLRKMYKDGKETDSARKGDIVSIPSKHFTNGTNVYMTSKDLEKELSESMRFKHIGIDIYQETGFLVFKADDAIIKSDIVLQEAKQHPLDIEQAKEVLMRSREIGVIWDIRKFEVPNNLFMPISKLGNMRKELEEHLLDRHTVKRQSCYEGLPDIAEKRFEFSPRLIVKVYDADQVAEAEDAGAYAIHFDAFSEDVIKARKLCKKARFFLDTPVILTDSDIKKVEEIIRKVNPDGLVIGNWGLLDIEFKGEKHGKYSLNVFNDISVEELRKRSITPTVSVELNAKQVMKFKNKEFIYYADGNIPVMHFKGVYDGKILKDELGYEFPLRIVNNNTEMLYSRPIAVLEHAKELADAGIRYFLLDLTSDVGRITRAYHSILAGEKKDVSHLKEGTTLGNYNKGVA
ncbi:MAG: U32 family peptidase, partial [Candidatus Woesearchaeota archaeon]|nr:U32 family peptidase [Candidatus Woesearchaeota archaeon]